MLISPLKHPQDQASDGFIGDRASALRMEPKLMKRCDRNIAKLIMGSNFQNFDAPLTAEIQAGI
ncbi:MULTISPECIES: hypothetical protein [Planktothricoides]|uniref:Uncharacterized protein n=2 Tax=Planktothricoides raciborskii TaxID=132608 RepID=A0AAU8JCK5_9CYAN|nr:MULTISPECIES: hypothetical protein [Planktothricoides]KOR36782.1 hypothetical protein AM228_10340 [Planktothricoides sp. SR001]MBD2545059.1 hypothetical protein [Planktothricoides raciborskii FACHB-1370]MBD2584285.1 hypothetical protein [Planktothricoides raciborskii FACHB-1261]